MILLWEAKTSSVQKLVQMRQPSSRDQKGCPNFAHTSLPKEKKKKKTLPRPNKKMPVARTQSIHIYTQRERERERTVVQKKLCTYFQPSDLTRQHNSLHNQNHQDCWIAFLKIRGKQKLNRKPLLLHNRSNTQVFGKTLTTMALVLGSAAE